MLDLTQLPPEAFRRWDESPDPIFYAQPRFVTHIDAGAIAAVTQLYREYFPAGGDLLDVCSSWVSHLPEDIAYRQVIGIGLNAAELAANPRLTQWFVHDLNANPCLPLPDACLDAAGLCVSVDYLAHPIAVLRDVGRVLRPGGPLVITFSNRCFPTKAIAIWLALTDHQRCRLVEGFLQAAGVWRDIQTLDRSPGGGDPLYAVIGRRV
ncbi:MAG: methyltransferase domain-containing protein [Chloracidobacterium sp.]|uniref:Methyltransferase domain-containing protein n=1 Tax=Chloracidobacterium validum TaxID=2821543 RepID=A0ABX8BAZ2_9BACT|nr:methyltransferase domain-containing protein [Chloracidobacterium validum]QUW04102.1 methyltransferase domain-containing protein [Chloracidobacterium validum]